jgi:hypothetical protein
MTRYVDHTDEISESPCSTKIAQLSLPETLDEILPFCAGKMQIDAQRCGESPFRQHELEGEAPEKKQSQRRN